MSANNQFQNSPRSTTPVVSAGLLLILICASLFALYKSNSAFSSDEVWSVKVSSLDYSAEMSALKADVHPPLYYQVLYFWIRVFGTGERTVRGLSALFYLLTVCVVYRLGYSLYCNKTALLSAAIYTCSPLAILSAQFARMYALLSLLSVLSTWFYVQFSVNERKPKSDLVLYVMVNVLGTFTHIGFFFVLFAHLSYHVLFRRNVSFNRFLVSFALSVIPFVAFWSPILSRQVTQSQQGLAWLSKPGISSIIEMVIVYGGAFWFGMPLLAYLWWRGGFTSLRDSINRMTWVPIWLLSITIATPLLISQIKPIFNSRLAIVGLHLFALGIAVVIPRRAIYFLVLQQLVLTAAGLALLHPGFSPCDNRAIASYISSTSKDGDVVIFTSLTRLPIDYYLANQPTKKRLFETSFPAEIDIHPGYEGDTTNSSRVPELEHEAEDLVQKIKELKGSEGKILFLHGFHPRVDTILQRRLEKQFKLETDAGIECDETSAYFKRLSVYK